MGFAHLLRRHIRWLARSHLRHAVKRWTWMRPDATHFWSRKQIVSQVFCLDIYIYEHLYVIKILEILLIFSFNGCQYLQIIPICLLLNAYILAIMMMFATNLAQMMKQSNNFERYWITLDTVWYPGFLQDALKFLKSFWNAPIVHNRFSCDNSKINMFGSGNHIQVLVGGLEHGFYFPEYMGYSNPSHWLSYFSRLLSHHQPESYEIIRHSKVLTIFLQRSPQGKTPVRSNGEDGCNLRGMAASGRLQWAFGWGAGRGSQGRRTFQGGQRWLEWY